jgi:hypothetical protein
MTSNILKVYVPGETSVVTDVNGVAHVVDIDADGRRFVMLTVETVKPFLESGLVCSLPWRELNPSLLNGALGPVEKPQPGINIARYMAARTAPAPRSPLDKGGQVNDTLRAMGQMMRRRPR